MPILIVYVMLIASVVAITTLNITKRPLGATAGEDTTDEKKRSQTADLLGDEAYKRMTEKVDLVMHTHYRDNCRAVKLTSGTESGEGAKRLHHLLPGDDLYLQRADCGDVVAVDVYNEGRKVGTLMLSDAEVAVEIMSQKCVTGVYVAEQNCFGDCPKTDLTMIIFFKERNAEDFSQPYAMQGMEFLAKADGPHPMLLFQN